MRRRHLWVVIILLFALTSMAAKPPPPSPPHPAGQQDAEALKQKADAALNGNQADRLHNLDDIIKYADFLAERGQKKEALPYFSKALEIHPWRMECQLKTARIMKDLGDPEGMKKRLSSLLPFIEQDGYYAEACRELEQPVDLSLQPIERISGKNHVIVVVPVGPWTTCS